MFVGLHVAVLLTAVRQEVKGEGGFEKGEWWTWNDITHRGRSNWDVVADGVRRHLMRLLRVCWRGGWGGGSSAGSGGTRSLSNGGSGGCTVSSPGTTTSIPWCSGAGWNLGRCFGNQGGSWSADGLRENTGVSEGLCVSMCKLMCFKID